MDRRWQTLWNLGIEMDRRFGLPPTEVALWLFRGLLLRWLEDRRVQESNAKHRLLDYEIFQYPLIVPLLAREMENLHPALQGLFPPQYDWGPLIFVLDALRPFDLSDLDPPRLRPFLMEGLAEFPWDYPLTDGIMTFLLDTLAIGAEDRVYLPQAGTSPLLFALERRTKTVVAWDSSPLGPFLRTLWFFLERDEKVFAQEVPAKATAHRLLACGGEALSPLEEYGKYLQPGGRLLWISTAKDYSLQQWVSQQGGHGVLIQDPDDPISLFFWQKPQGERDGVWAAYPFPDGEGEPYPPSWQTLIHRVEEAFQSEGNPPIPPLSKPVEKPSIRSWIETLPDLNLDDWSPSPQGNITPEEPADPADPSPRSTLSEEPPEEIQKEEEPTKPAFTPLARQVHNLYKSASSQYLKKK